MMEEKEKGPDEETLATFRISDEVWKKFKQWAKENETTRSRELKKFIDACLSGSVPVVASPGVNYGDMETQIGNCIDKALAPIIERMEVIEKKLAEPTGKQTAKVTTMGVKGAGLTATELNSLLRKADPVLGEKVNWVKEWREKSPDVLGDETMARLGVAYEYRGGNRKYYPLEKV